jgi:hypothetical protein
MKQVEDGHRDNHHSPIERNKVRFVCNEVTRPTLRQLNRTVDLEKSVGYRQRCQAARIENHSRFEYRYRR